MQKHPIVFAVLIFTLGGAAGAGMWQLHKSGKLSMSKKATA
ncbi:MAG TPA: hypothetical protein VEU33_03530 [Archangium sp.]|nr:hypothetical protein [Archangium sp.]